MKEIQGMPKNLKQLLQNTKYSIHYYQREYMWQRKHIEELLDDLTSEFLEYYKPGDARAKVADYGGYFMGSIVLTGRENAIIDGQQRLSSLTLLLMYLNNRLNALDMHSDMIQSMIYSESLGTSSFNLNVEERQPCMEAIYQELPFDAINESESVKNLYGRYCDIAEMFDKNDIKDDMLPYFCDWLAEKVFFIEIIASIEQDAHKIFVTMNDRGLSLTPTEMLKGYLLSEIKDDTARERLNALWKKKVLELKKYDDRGDENFIKAWLRAQYAETIRETRAGAVNKDFDLIGGPFHKWVRDEKEKLQLDTPEDYEAFIKKFARFADVYIRIQQAESVYSEDTKYVYYNAQLNFTLQPQVLMAPICLEDTWDVVTEKMELAARYLDLFIYARVTNYSSVDYSTIKNNIFTLCKEIRRAGIEELKEKLKEDYFAMNYQADVALPNFGLNNFTKKYIKHLLARVTSHLEEQSGVASNYCNYISMQTKNPYEIEHILTDHYEWFSAEYNGPEDFKWWRNSIGALLLLHKSINASLNDARYEDKRNKYCSNEGNIYTESLGPTAYQNNPRFIRYIRENELPFQAYDSFGKKEIQERTQLLVQLYRLIWNVDMFQ